MLKKPVAGTILEIRLDPNSGRTRYRAHSGNTGAISLVISPPKPFKEIDGPLYMIERPGFGKNARLFLDPEYVDGVLYSDGSQWTEKGPVSGKNH